MENVGPIRDTDSAKLLSALFKLAKIRQSYYRKINGPLYIFA